MIETNWVPQLGTYELNQRTPSSFTNFNRLLTDTPKPTLFNVLSAIHDRLGQREIPTSNPVGQRAVELAVAVAADVRHGTTLGFDRPRCDATWGLLFGDEDYRQALAENHRLRDRVIVTQADLDTASEKLVLTGLAICVEKAAGVYDMEPPSQVSLDESHQMGEVPNQPHAVPPSATEHIAVRPL